MQQLEIVLCADSHASDPLPGSAGFLWTGKTPAMQEGYHQKSGNAKWQACGAGYAFG
jgi:hypothetical protein